MNGQIVTLSDDGLFLETQTLLWAAGIKPKPNRGSVLRNIISQMGGFYVDFLILKSSTVQAFMLWEMWSLLTEEKYS